MGNVIGCCLRPEESNELGDNSPHETLLRRMASFDEEHDTQNLHASNSARAGEETSGSRLLRDFFQHVVESDLRFQPRSDSGEEDAFHESIVVQRNVLEKAQLSKQKEAQRHVPPIDPLTMYSSLGLFHTNEASLLRDDRLVPVKSPVAVVQTKHLRENSKYKPFWTDKPSKHASAPAPMQVS
ncbi:hypothetical protein AC1031_003446 [Aphanomyces cochlioides]|nr:hypothetical protein AC1031_003446 [Aphanomyces cochlioides]